MERSGLYAYAVLKFLQSIAPLLQVAGSQTGSRYLMCGCHNSFQPITVSINGREGVKRSFFLFFFSALSLTACKRVNRPYKIQLSAQERYRTNKEPCFSHGNLRTLYLSCTPSASNLRTNNILALNPRLNCLFFSQLLFLVSSLLK